MNVLRASLPCIASRSVRETEMFGSILAKNVRSGLLILLYGDLGVGKTQLARAVGGALGAKNVKSPTFAIESIHTLPGKAFPFVHADLYRLQETGSTAMQLEEYLDDGGVVLVEWGEKWEKPPLANRWDIAISQIGDEARALRFSAFGDNAIALLSEAYTGILRTLEEDSPCR